MAKGVAESFIGGRGAALQQAAKRQAISQGAQRFGLEQQQGGLELQSQQQEIDRFTQEDNLKSMVQGALEFKSITDPSQQELFLNKRLADITARGGDATDTLELLNTPPEERGAVVDNVIGIGERMGIIEAAKQPKVGKFGQPFPTVAPSGQSQFSQLTPEGDVRTVPGIRPPVKKGQTIRSLPGGGFEVITGEGGGKPRRFSEVQAKTGGMAARVEAANAIAAELEDDPGFDPASISQAAKGAVPLAGNLLVTEDQRVFDQAKTDFISAVLRLESGAAISDAEYVRENKKYFPQPGDGPRVIANKRKARERQLEILKSNSGGSYDAIKKAIIISEHPDFGDVTEEDIAATMVKNRMTREAVINLLQGNGGK